MSWFKVDNDFPDHPKVGQAGGDAGWLYICALAYSNRYLTDGFVPSAMLGRISDRKDPAKLAKRLVDVGLWESADDGYRIHDYLDHQQSSEKVELERQKTAIRVAALRERRNGVSTEHVTPLPAAYKGVSTPDVRLLEVEVEVDRDVEVPEPPRKNSKPRQEPEGGGAAAPPAPTSSEPSADDLLDRVNSTLSGQPGWNPTPQNLVKLREIAQNGGVDLELQAMKIADYMRKPKRKGTQCTFRYVADWLGREIRSGSSDHAENRRHPGANGQGSRGAFARAGESRADEVDPFAQYVIRDEPAG